MPTEMRFDDLDLREEPARERGDAALATQVSHNCYNTRMTGCTEVCTDPCCTATC